MNRRTRSYLRGRFRDYYRRRTPAEQPEQDRPLVPPELPRREWAYIPFAAGDRAPMVRHQALVDGADLGDLLVQQRPRHVYHSTARYDDPDVEPMAAKGWRGADLVFDLDADHLPGVDPDADAYTEMLRACRSETLELLDLLEDDFAFDELFVVFSGNRGYHVHVRDESIRDLDRDARREIVDYVRGTGLSFDAIVRTEAVAGTAGTGTRRSLDVDAGWGRRLHRSLRAFLADVREVPRHDAMEQLCELDGVGEGIGESVLGVVDRRWDAIDAGEIDLHPDYVRFVRQFVDQRVAGSGPAIDEPVTTDVHRLIRLPGSLHGKTGLVVRPVDRNELDSFDPLTDAIAPDFTDAEITIEVTEPVSVRLGDGSWQLDPGEHVVPEYLGVFLMAREIAEKRRE